MKSKHQDIEALTIRKATIADTDKVRYRVYSTPKDFIAVIAESALMAVKVSGIKKPHKIVRDLPTEGVAIEAKKMAAIDTAAARIALPVKKLDVPDQLMADIAPIDPNLKQSLFRPMTISELQSPGHKRVRILPPELLNEIIEQHTKAQMPQPAAAPEMPSQAPAQPVAEAPDPFDHTYQAPVIPPREPSAEEKLMAMAQSMPAAAPVEPAANDEPELSPEEVAKLLNG